MFMRMVFIPTMIKSVITVKFETSTGLNIAIMPSKSSIGTQLMTQSVIPITSIIVPVGMKRFFSSCTKFDVA